MSQQNTRFAACGCCEPPAPATPLAIANRPGLAAIAHRIGTFASFRQAMLHAIALEPALRGLTTRRSDDPAITLLELWAAIGDVLTFYQERIANEAFLRTARERDSVLRLARMLDYHLRPGIAATTRLVFTADAGKKVRIPAGLRVMSIPGQGESPQTFETVEAFTADARLNRLAILPKPFAVNPLGQRRLAAFLTADFAGWLAAKKLMPNDNIVLYGGWSDEGTSGGGSLSQDTAFDGPGTAPIPPKKYSPAPSAQQTVQMWQGERQPVYQALAIADTSDSPEEKKVKEIRVEGNRFLLIWTTPIVKHGWTQETQARVFKRKVKVFGYDAPEKYAMIKAGTWATWESVSVSFALSATTKLPLDAVYRDLVTGDELLIHELGQAPRVVTVTDVTDGEEVLGPPLPEKSLADHRYRATVTVATLSESLSIADRRNATIYLLSGGEIPLWTGDFPSVITEGPLYIPAVKLDEAGEVVEIGRTVEGQEMKAGVAIRLDEIDTGRSVLLQDHARLPVLATITGVWLETIQGQDFLALGVASLSEVELQSQTAVLLGNVAAATHGETVRDEILGNGDAALSFQRFQLRKLPVTYVPSAQSTQGKSTLAVEVAGETWRQVETLFHQSPTDRVYTVRHQDDGATTVQFGDGVTGARLPTGQANVAATYRHGSGMAGRVGAAQLSILLDHQVGLASVTNPAGAEGGAGPETLANARTTVPTTVKTFGRAVSLLDFVSLIQASGEVARASATWVWRGLEKVVHLTVAAQEGEPFSKQKLKMLHDGLSMRRDPNQIVVLDNVCRVPLILKAKLQWDSRYAADDVLGAALAAVFDFFAFENMDFGKPVHLSDVYRILQNVTGVVAVDIDELHFKGHAAWNARQLAARGAAARPVQAHLRIFGARPRPATVTDPIVLSCFGRNVPAVLPAEQAFIEDESTDVTLMLGDMEES